MENLNCFVLFQEVKSFSGRHYIRRRGENRSSFEVEKIVSSHPDVEESAAIGIKSEAGKYAEDELMILIIPKERR